jgi:predicted RNA-binding protein with PUA-like domain
MRSFIVLCEFLFLLNFSFPIFSTLSVAAPNMSKRARGEPAARSCAYWLMKSEPDVFSIGDLRRKKLSPWDGVRNYGARNNMQKMAVGDMVIFYHSNGKPSGAAGVARVCKLAYPDYTAVDKSHKYYDPRASAEKNPWEMVDVEFVEEFGRLVPLEELKQDPALSSMVLFSQGRLSVQPVDSACFAHIVELGRMEAEPLRRRRR